MPPPALPLTGGCLCGAVRYAVRARPLLAVACHCRDCQKRTSTAYSLNMPVPKDAFALIAGAPALRWRRCSAANAACAS